MAMYDRHTFETGLLPKALKKDVREIIEVAVAVGWHLHISSNQGCTIIAPDERKRYHFSLTRATTSLNRIRRDVFKFGDPSLVVMMDELVDGKVSPDVAAMIDKVAHPTPADMPQKKEQPEPSEPEVKAVPYIVSERPMLAKAGQNRGYESAATVERRWSDGSVDYKCVDCDYSHRDRLSVRSHRNKHGRSDRKHPQTFVADVPNASHYKPRQARIDALADALREAFKDTNKSDFGAVAREALTWVHEQSRQGTPLAAEQEELSPEDTLNRIRSLLDDGTAARARQQVDAMSEQMVALEQQLQDARARADKAQATLKALSELASESVLSEDQTEALREARGA